jgi:Holliday junction resolvasome RuvABC endonuclease subunit
LKGKDIRGEKSPLIFYAMNRHLCALDLSLNSTGVCIFTMEGDCIEKLTIDTHKIENTQLKLREIGNIFENLIEKYDFEIIVMEKGFSRFNKSTQQLYRVHGIANYIFSEFKQIYYPSGTIKKLITGKGNASKELVHDCLIKGYPNIKFENYDESDAFAVGESYFLKKGIKNAKKN